MALAVLREELEEPELEEPELGEPELEEPELGDAGALRRAADLARPVTLAGQRSLPVVEALESLLPEGIRRGATVTVAGGPGSTAMALALGVAASRAGSWVGMVGTPSIGLLAATELGIVPERLLVVAHPPAASTATVVAALVDSVDVVYVRGAGIAAADARRLLARARERGAVLIALGQWSLAADVRLTVAAPSWCGTSGNGAGRLVARTLDVTASGKGVYARERRARLWLPDPNGSLSCASSP